MIINRIIASVLPFLPKRMIWIFSKKYIAGEYITDAFRESEKLNTEGSSVTIDILGENISQLSEADIFKIQYIDVIEQFTARKINGKFLSKTLYVWSNVR